MSISNNFKESLEYVSIMKENFNNGFTKKLSYRIKQLKNLDKMIVENEDYIKEN